MPTHRMSAKEALKKLQDGNIRYASTFAARGDDESQSSQPARQSSRSLCHRDGLFDSRVPAEIVFDQLGELFVIRVVRNIVARHNRQRRVRRAALRDATVDRARALGVARSTRPSRR